MFGGSNPVNQESGPVIVEIAIDARSFDQARNSITVSRRDPVLQEMPGYGAIHRARIYVVKT